jgi:hypothetical protein
MSETLRDPRALLGRTSIFPDHLKYNIKNRHTYTPRNRGAVRASVGPGSIVARAAMSMQLNGSSWPPLVARLAADGGAVHYGPSAFSLDDVERVNHGRDQLLIYVHSYNVRDVDSQFSRQFRLPLMQAVQLVRESAFLLFCNNKQVDTGVLISQLRAYPQRSRWLMHSSRNEGYRCGEMLSLASSPSVWSRYAWVLHTHTDQLITPEFYLRLEVHLARLEPSIAFVLDPFPGGYHRLPRYNMEVVVFRPELMWIPNTTDDGASHTSQQVHDSIAPHGNRTVFDLCLEFCTRPPTKFHAIPEDLLHIFSRQQKLKVDSTLGAAPKAMRLWNGKTQLFPGGVWHTHNATAIAAYLSAVERGESVMLDSDFYHYYMEVMNKQQSQRRGQHGAPHVRRRR